ncbi:hypothetical protein B0H13DRAFT_2326780 [Mycena leptocephala]|nr:hypothetical protein B0H13DRAFT_2326780 [Mycena leptocephala]
MTRVDDMGDKSPKTRKLPFRVFKLSRPQTKPTSLVLYFHHLAKSPSPPISSSFLLTRAWHMGGPACCMISSPVMTGRAAPNPSSVYNGQRLPGKGEQLAGGCTCGVLLGDLSRELGRTRHEPGASLDSLDDSRRNAWYRYGLDKVLGRHRSMSEPPPIRLEFATVGISVRDRHEHRHGCTRGVVPAASWKLKNGIHAPKYSVAPLIEEGMESLVWCPFHASPLHAERAEEIVGPEEEDGEQLEERTKEDGPLFSTFLLIFSHALFQSRLVNLDSPSFPQNWIIQPSRALFGHIASGPTPVPLSSSYCDCPALPRARPLRALDYPAVCYSVHPDHFVADRATRRLEANPKVA